MTPTPVPDRACAPSARAGRAASRQSSAEGRAERPRSASSLLSRGVLGPRAFASAKATGPPSAGSIACECGWAHRRRGLGAPARRRAGGNPSEYVLSIFNQEFRVSPNVAPERTFLLWYDTHFEILLDAGTLIAYLDRAVFDCTEVGHVPGASLPALVAEEDHGLDVIAVPVLGTPEANEVTLCDAASTGTCYDRAGATCVIFNPFGGPPHVQRGSCSAETDGCDPPPPGG